MIGPQAHTAPPQCFATCVHRGGCLRNHVNHIISTLARLLHFHHRCYKAEY